MSLTWLWLFSNVWKKCDFSVCYDLQKNEKPIGDEFVTSALIRQGQFDEVGMLDLMSANPITNIDAYLKNLVDMSQKRSLALVASNMRQQIVDEEILNAPQNDIINE